jgi:hypothetical protein
MLAVKVIVGQIGTCRSRTSPMSPGRMYEAWISQSTPAPRRLDHGLGVAGMDGGLAAEPVRHGDDGLHLLVGEAAAGVGDPLLRLAVAADLDQVDPVLHLPPHLGQHRVAGRAEHALGGDRHAEPARESSRRSRRRRRCDGPRRRCAARGTCRWRWRRGR